MTRSSDITSFTEFRAHLRDHLNQRKTSNRPLFVTTNGETEAVVISPSAFDELMDLADLGRSLTQLDQGMEDVKAGRTRPAKKALRQIARELRLKIDR